MFTTRAINAVELGLRGRANLFLVGAVTQAPRVAIVGSRAARRQRLALLDAAVAVLAAQRLALVSGGAIGIDAGAHRAALAAGVPQLAVLPCGADRPYPPHHVPLFRSIAAAPASGLIFCHPPGTEACRAMFASRNAVVIGLAAAVVVVEAGLRSGSHGTGISALHRKLPVAAVLDSPGCADLVARGAAGLPGEPEAFGPALSAWLARLGGAAAPPPPPWPPALAWLDAALREAGPRGLCLDALPDPLIRLVDLLEAERLGLVVEAPPGRYRRVG